MSRPEANPRTDRYVVGLDEVGTDALPTVGGKGASLGALIDAGFAVPDGFCVTTSAYQSLLTDELREQIRALADVDPSNHSELERRAADIRSRFRTLALPAELSAQVAEALSECGAASYAVRSSATAEDLPTASFAGQHETYLGVEPGDVAARVVDCMASLYTDRAVAYRSRNGLSHESVALAVVVQAMVDAEAAGVLFTADPDTGNRTVASIDAAFGIGESVVAGAVEADNARVEKPTGEVLSYDVGRKQSQLSMANGETRRIELPADEQQRRVLSDEQVAELVGLGNIIESHFGRPQDIEWALLDGDILILQSRPITSLFPLPEPMPSDDNLHVYLSMGHTQAMAEAMPPLAVDLWLALVERMLDEFAASSRDGQWAVHAGGRVYEDITPFLRHSLIRGSIVSGLESLVEQAAVGLDELIERREDEFKGRVSLSLLSSLGRDAVWLIRDLGPILPGVLWGIVSGYLLSFKRAGADMPEIRRFYQTWGEETAAKLVEPTDMHEQAARVFEGLPFDTPTLMKEVYPRFMPLMGAMTAQKILKSLFPADHDAIVAAGRGSTEEVGTRMNLGLDAIEGVAREHPAVENALLAEQSVDEIAAVEGGDAFVAELDTFLAEFGHRTNGEIDPSRPRWRDDPNGVLQLVRGNLRAGSERTYREHLRERQEAAVEALNYLQSKANRGFLGLIRGPLVRRLLHVYRGYIPLRDEPKQGSAHLFAAWHEGPQRIGEYLAANGQLADADDVWYLRKDELFDLLDSGDPAAIDFEERRREHERFARIDAPALMTSEGEAVTKSIASNLGGNVLVGTGVSSGVVEGFARVVLDPRQTTVEPGEILVAPSCDPTWTPLFLNAEGLVADVGGRMTHGALVAREYGLPAVMSIPKATKRIETGDRIRVDGTRGTVELLD